jgi:O-antigen ligase
MSLPQGISIDRQPAAPRASTGSGARSHNRQRRLNGLLAVILVAIVAIAPVLLGSNRPFFWALWATVIGGVAFLYGAVLLLRGESLRMPLGRLWLPALLLVALLIFLAVQMLPLATTFATATGDAVASATLSLAPGATWSTVLQFATYGLFFFLMLQVASNRSRARRIGVALFVIVVAHALYGLFALTLLDDSLLFFPKWAYAGFATGGFVNRNSFATFLAFGLVLGVLLASRELKSSAAAGRSNAAMVLAGSALILATLVATGSRMGLFAGLLGAALAALMAGAKGEPATRIRGLLLAAIPVVAAIVVLLLYGAGTFDRLGSIENDANVRGDLYAQVIGMIAARPWLGYGGGAFELAYPLFHQLPVNPDLVWDKAHSTYLSLWAELGVIAGSIPLLLLAWIGVDALRLYLGRRSGDWTAPAAAVAVTLVAALHSTVDFSLEMQANAFFLLAVLAVGIARTDTRRDGGEAESA